MLHTRDLSEVDTEQLDEVLQAFYEVISFDDGSAPDWERMSGLFSAHARITRVTPEAIDYMDLNTFRSMAEELLEVGAYTSLYEREIARRADRFGDVIHVASAYETKISPAAKDYIERGVNSLQLIREQGRWRIISLCWDDHALFSLDQEGTGMQPVAQGEVSRGQS
jgi:SnoaL-like domain